MVSLPRPLALAGFALGVAFALPLAAADQPASGSSVDDQDAVSLRGIFDFQLPKILWPKSLRFTLNPLFGDLAHKDSVRIRTGVRYAFTRHFEASAEVLPYLDNFGGQGGGAGIAEYRLGTKFAWHTLLSPYVDTAMGATIVLPAPGAPEELSLGTTRFNPYLVFSRDWTPFHGFTTFLNLGYEVFDHDPKPGLIADYRPARDNLSITPGVVLHRAPWHYTFATSLRTTAPAGESHEYFSVLPSVSYEIPPKLMLRLPGRLVVGAGYEAIFFGDDTEHRVTTRIRWDIDWRKAARDLGDNVRNHLSWNRTSQPTP